MRLLNAKDLCIPIDSGYLFNSGRSVRTNGSIDWWNNEVWRQCGKATSNFHFLTLIFRFLFKIQSRVFELWPHGWQERRGMFIQYDWVLTISFEINEDNWKELALLSDKYAIDSLQMDLRVCFLSNMGSQQNYVQRFIAWETKPTFDLWVLAARHQFVELEQYCRADYEVYKTLKGFMRNHQKGLAEFVASQGIPIRMMSGLVSGLVKQADKFEEQRDCNHCNKTTTPKICCSYCSSNYYGFGLLSRSWWYLEVWHWKLANNI